MTATMVAVVGLGLLLLVALFVVVPLVIVRDYGRWLGR